ncbi:bifunctional DNA-formamidopyrimidine glycosylase/DNA-(apurinic or apyrimidinic site) lyase [Nocardiopsis sp. EMB25]|uniref:bifunctional DNA-formamidopyrimidine glycosylase/DNA-(apurinic or apyrimidinic site) lyase n=1 Tax=Nocardiopsis sp. EMB25 TaxID=2835867 RepID=UPI002283D4A5|nr:bifunctional DNA-formamidopyrimidine glycosylase/DNA-(apurinic or apyrimidinic site) lyase [Nocardiopsis sp. EMB25]MCY9787811.1 bifunctional DNA-formamidopyrimidine glycosylase/DNA-(apurinic or apyrimidinic site) lyase [Nocardiopsis sp. EMB25]
MPELPEVEVVRRGLATHALGRTVSAVEVLHPRSVRRHVPGAADFTARLEGRVPTAARRRGKYLWLSLDSGEMLLTHLGMSGQMLVQPQGKPDERHLRVRLPLSDGQELRFVDQRTFGHLLVDTPGERDDVPASVDHIALDPLDPVFAPEAFVRALRARRTEVKRALLDQSLISGVGNIYADEALWRSRLHWSRSTQGLSSARATELLGHVRDVMNEALAVGGTTFDGLYVNVNGESGYFERGLNAYGREDRPCGRCGAPIIREAFMNRSSFSCPRCQRAPRTRR